MTFPDSKVSPKEEKNEIRRRINVLTLSTGAYTGKPCAFPPDLHEHLVANAATARHDADGWLDLEEEGANASFGGPAPRRQKKNTAAEKNKTGQRKKRGARAGRPGWVQVVETWIKQDADASLWAPV